VKLSDVMGAADLVIYAEVGLVLFLGAFLAVVARVLWFDKRENYEEIEAIPLCDEPIHDRHTEAATLLMKESLVKEVLK
jgi:cbb3-type cytochrome oxidase subunit 3